MREISASSPAEDFVPTWRRGVNVAHFLTQTARRLPKGTAVVDPDYNLSWTWSELDQRATALAADLQAHGLGRRDTVLLVAANCAGIIQSFWGVIRAGMAIASPNAALSATELLDIAFDVAPAAVIVDEGREEVLAGLREQGFTGPVYSVHELPAGLGQPVGSGSPGVSAQPEHLPDTALPDTEVEENDPCWYFFTSGSTGRPKAATFTHRHLGAVLANHRCDLFPDETADGASLVIAPLSHGAGIHMLAQVFAGTASVILSGGRVDQTTIWDTIDRHRITNAFTVPTILNRIAAGYPAERGPSEHSLRRIVYAGAPMLAADQARALERLGPCLVQYFGLAEVTGAITVLRPEEHGTVPVDSAGIGTCGRARTGVEIVILDETGVECALGVSGEVCVTGPTVFAGYLGRPDANEEAFVHGAFHTGDIGYLDSMGYLFLTGRKSDMYISGGSNVYPREIEELLLTDAEVAQAIVVGVPDAQWGEIGVAVIEPVDLGPAAGSRAGVDTSAGGEASVDELIERLRRLAYSSLARYKVPKEFHLVESLPVTAYGKIDRKEITAEYSRGRGSAR